MPESDTMSKSDTDTLSAGEVALILGVNPRTVARKADFGDLGEVTMTEGGHRRFTRAGIEAYIAKAAVAS